MKILCIGDQHFKSSNIPVVEIFLKKLEEWLSLNKVDIIVSMGDLLHTHERLHTQPLNKAIEYIQLLSTFAITYVMVGNHDFVNNSQYNSENHWLNCVKDYNNVVVVDKVIEVECEGVSIVLCPYVPDGKFKSSLEMSGMNWKSSSLIFAHQLFDGAKMGAIVAENVEKWEKEDPMLICAHIHDCQWVQDNLYIVGSVLQEAFGEGEDKSLLLLDIKESDKKLNKDILLRKSRSEYPTEALRKSRSESPTEALRKSRSESPTEALRNKNKFSLIDLELPKKKIIYMDIEELDTFDTFKLKENTEYKLTLDGEEDEFNAFKKTTKYKELSKKVKIVFKHKRAFLVDKKEKIEGNKSIVHKNFNTILEELVKEEDNPYIYNLFNKMVLGIDVESEIIIIY